MVEYIDEGDTDLDLEDETFYEFDEPLEVITELTTAHTREANWVGEGMRVVLRVEKGATHKALRDDLPLHFQAPPLEEFGRDYAHTHNDYDTVKGKQYSTSGSDLLTTVSFDTLQTIDIHPWTVHEEHFGLRRYEHVLKEVKRRGTPVRLVAFHDAMDTPEIDMPVTLRDFRVTEKAGEIDARYFTMSFVQWRDAQTNRRDKGRWPKTHKLKANDSLMKLAHQYYGKTRGWRKIGDKNPGLHVWGGRTLIIWHPDYKAGDKIKIPHPPERQQGNRNRDNGSGGVAAPN